VAAPAPFAEVADRIRNWGRWGPDDQIGTLNLIDRDARMRAAGAVTSGKAFTLGLPLSEAEGIQAGFIKGRVNPTRSMIQVNEPLSPDPDWVCSSEDVVTLALQCATHWDALAHCSYGGVIYNGYPASSVTEAGASVCGIAQLTTVVSRGLLLDLPRALGLDVLEPGYAIRPEDLDAACALGRLEVAPGDIVLVRTGQMVHLAAPRDGRVVPRPRRGRGGHRHPGLRGLSLPVRGHLPTGAPLAPGGDGDDPRTELGVGRAGGGLRR
jgi:hypothetical protein